MSPEDPVPRPKPLRPIPWWFAVCGLAAIGLSIWGVHGWLSSAASGAETAKDAQVQVDIIRNALTVGAGLGGVAALLLAFRRQQFVERQHQFAERQQAHHERVTELDYQQRERDATHRRITEMRIQAVEQLGSDKAPVRIGGLHNLERLGEDHPELRPLVLSEICAYLRMPFRVPAAALRLTDSEAEPESLDEHHVRQTAQRVLKRHLSGGPADPRFWEHTALDLSDATLHSLDLRGCRLHDANFYFARFHGTTKFEGTAFHGGANFANAEFHGAAWFVSATFEDDPVFDAATAVTAPVKRDHFWPDGWELTPDPRRDGMGRLRRTDRSSHRLQ